MTEQKKIRGRAIYSTAGAAWEYGRVGCNFYKGCPHGCTYCYLKRGAPSKQLGGNKAELKKCFKDNGHAIEVFCSEMGRHIDLLRQTGVFLSFSTDPLIPETRDLTITAMGCCVDNDIPVKILTKNADFLSYPRMQLNLRAAGVKELVQFGFTLTGRDDMEPNASSNYERICAMRDLHRRGFRTFASIEPVIDWKSSQMVIRVSIDDCDHYMIGLRSGVGKDYYDLAESGAYLQQIVGFVTERGKTVYLKESTRKLLKRFLNPDGYEPFMSYTVDMDGNPYQRHGE